MGTIAGILIYFFVFLFFLHRINRSAGSLLSTSGLTLAFAAKVLAGLAYGYIFLKYYHGDDTWAFHWQSLGEREKLLHQPALFFEELLPISAIQGATEAWQVIPYYLVDLENAILPKSLALFDLFSGNNYYINVVFFNFFLFFGPYWFYALLMKHFPAQKRMLFIVIFLVPTFVFWLSGIRADGILFLFLSLLLFHFSKWLSKRNIRSGLIILFSMTGLLIFRNAVLMLLLPGLAAWWLAEYKSQKPGLVFTLAYLVGTALFFTSPFISSHTDLPGMVASRQKEYLALQANTRYTLDLLEPDLMGFLKVVPQALYHVFLRPFPWEVKGLLQLLESLSVYAFWLIIILFAFFRKAGWKKSFSSPLLLTFLFYGAGLYLFIGLMVPFPGAIARYKISGTLLLILPFLVQINWKKLYYRFIKY